jgi:hypothetical protein
VEATGLPFGSLRLLRFPGRFEGGALGELQELGVGQGPLRAEIAPLHGLR